MNIINYISKTGEWFLKYLSANLQIFIFIMNIFAVIFKANSYNASIVGVFTKQIYFTVIKILPLFLLISAFFGFTFVGTLVSLSIEYSLTSEIGSIIVNGVLNEIAPLITILLLALRSSSAMNTEIAVMSVSGELKALEWYNVDIIQYMYAPRVFGMIVSVFILTMIFIFIVILSGYIFLYFFMQMGLDIYLQSIIDSIEVGEIINYILKSFLFGIALSVMPIYYGSEAKDSLASISNAILIGMIRLFVVIFFIEVFTLAIQLL